MKTCASIVQTERGLRINISREVSAVAEHAWVLLTEVKYWTEWGPLVTDVDYPHSALEVDTSGRIQLMNMFWIPFKIRQLDENSWSWTIFNLTPPADGHRIELLDSGSCRICFELPVWAIVYLPVCYFALRRLETLLTANNLDNYNE